MSENIGLTNTKDCDACSLWKDVPLRNFMTYTNVSACKFSHRRMCLYTTCHIISHVCARPTCFHAVCRLRDVFMCVFAHKKDVCLHTFRIRKTWVCVTFNTWHNVSPNFPMFYDNRRASTRISRLYVMFMHKLTHQKTCLLKLFDLWRCVWVQFDT